MRRRRVVIRPFQEVVREPTALAQLRGPDRLAHNAIGWVGTRVRDRQVGEGEVARQAGVLVDRRARQLARATQHHRGLQYEPAGRRRHQTVPQVLRVQRLRLRSRALHQRNPFVQVFDLMVGHGISVAPRISLTDMWHRHRIGNGVLAALLGISVVPHCDAGQGAAEGSLAALLPMPDTRVPWSNLYSHFRYAPSGDAIAFLGTDSKSPAQSPVSGRSDVTADAVFGLGFCVMDWARSSEPAFFDLATYGLPTKAGSWSPDGAEFAQTTSTGAGTKIWLYSRKSGGIALLASAPTRRASNASWSPSGAELAVVMSRRLSMTPTGPALPTPVPVADDAPTPTLGNATEYVVELHIYDVSTKAERSLQLFDAEQPIESVVAWSPGVPVVAVVMEKSWGEYLLYFVSAESMTITAASTGDSDCIGSYEAPQWCTSGKYLAATGTPSGNVLMIESDSGGAIASQHVLKLEHMVSTCAWVPNTTRLLIYGEIDKRTLGDAVRGLPGLMENAPKRLQHAVWLLDAETGEAELQPEFCVTTEESWRKPHSLPRVAEAFARWKR